MRWSQIICLFTVLLGITFDQVLARPVVDASFDVKLVRRGKAQKLSISGVANLKANAGTLAKTAHLKTSNYRNMALTQGQEYDPATKAIVHNGNLNKQTATHLDADHVFEVQTALKTINKHNIDPKHHDAIKNVLNHPDNLVMAPSTLNREKGSRVRSALGGKSRTPSAATKEYMQTTSQQALHVAGQLDSIVGGTHFTDAQNDVHKQAGI